MKQIDDQRNGSSGKTGLTDNVPFRLEVPSDRDASFEPLLIREHDRRVTGFDGKLIAIWAGGMTVHDLQGFSADQYAVEVSPALISIVTDEAPR